MKKFFGSSGISILWLIAIGLIFDKEYSSTPYIGLTLIGFLLLRGYLGIKARKSQKKLFE